MRAAPREAGTAQKIGLHKRRHNGARSLPDTGAERVDSQALLGHVNLPTTQIYTHVDQDRMAAVVNKL